MSADDLVAETIARHRYGPLTATAWSVDGEHVRVDAFVGDRGPTLQVTVATERATMLIGDEPVNEEPVDPTRLAVQFETVEALHEEFSAYVDAWDLDVQGGEDDGE